MLDFIRQLSPIARRSVPLRPFLRAAVLLLFGLLVARPAAGEDVRGAPLTSPEPGLPFAIADFDGDHRPDLASIQTGASEGSRTNYWIRLQLTAAGPQSIRVVAPFGGLVLAARDVNGDHAVDLVITTAWLKQPVAILLNDGHGNFTRADPTAFPGAFRESETNWASSSGQTIDVVGVPPPSLPGIHLETQGLPNPQAQAGLLPPSSSGFLFGPFLISQRGRAPPPEVTSL